MLRVVNDSASLIEHELKSNNFVGVVDDMVLVTPKGGKAVALNNMFVKEQR